MSDPEDLIAARKGLMTLGNKLEKAERQVRDLALKAEAQLHSLGESA